MEGNTICFPAGVHLEEFARRRLHFANLGLSGFSASAVFAIERALCSPGIALRSISLLSSREYD
jgi:hypothetical protein